MDALWCSPTLSVSSYPRALLNTGWSLLRSRMNFHHLNFTFIEIMRTTAHFIWKRTNAPESFPTARVGVLRCVATPSLSNIRKKKKEAFWFDILQCLKRSRILWRKRKVDEKRQKIKRSIYCAEDRCGEILWLANTCENLKKRNLKHSKKVTHPSVPDNSIAACKSLHTVSKTFRNSVKSSRN